MASKTFIVQGVRIDHHTKPANFEEISASYAKYQWADAYLFFTGIWAVKGSFLAYYDGLTRRLANYRRVWWATIVITVLTYIGSLFAYAFLDGLKFKTNLRNEAIKYQFAADFTTDVLITAIPLTIAMKSRVPAKQKLFLVGIFSLSLVITIFSIIRFALNSPTRGTAGPSWLECWSTIEQSVSVMVACLASIRTFVLSKNRSPKQSWYRRHQPSGYSSSDSKKPARTEGFGFHNLIGRRSGSMDIELLQPGSPTTLSRGATSAKGEDTCAAAIAPIVPRAELQPTD